MKSIPAEQHLDRVHDIAVQVERDARALIAPLSPTQRIWQPAPDSWSVSHCFDHLRVTGDLYLPRLRTAISQAGESPHGYRPNGFGRMFLRLSGPEVRFRIRAFKMFQPSAVVPAVDADAGAGFFAQQPEFLEQIDAARGRDLRVKVDSPLNPLFSLRLGECLLMLATHQQRHLEQARRVTEHPEFPAARA